MKKAIGLSAVSLMLSAAVAAAGRGGALTETVEPEGIMSRIHESIISNLILEDRWKLLTDGLFNTIKVSLWSIVFATILGGCLCALRMNRRKWAFVPVKWYVELMRSIPLLVLLLLMFYVVLTDVALLSVWIAIVSFVLYFSA